MLVAIDQTKEKKRQESLQNSFQVAQNQTGVVLEQTINNIDQQQGTQAYEDNRKKTEELKIRSATENPTEYSQNVQARVEERMKKNELNQESLTDPKVKEFLKKLNDSEIKDPAEIVKAEMAIVAEVEKISAEKQLMKLLSSVSQELTSAKSKEEKAAIKTRLLAFVNSSNIYFQQAYSKHKTEVKNLLNQLEDNSNSSTASPTGFPWKIVLPIAGILVLGWGVFIIRTKIKLSKTKKR